MDVKTAYNQWADQYDTNENRTRDLEALALRECLESLSFRSCLELGCGTGKNTLFLMPKARTILAVDFSPEMLAKAREKIQSKQVRFHRADISKPWNFTPQQFDLITFSLVLEHIEDLGHVFREASKKMTPGGMLYLGELHPYKQYTGSKARFETSEGTTVLPCFNHHISDFTRAAEKCGFSVLKIREYFDENDRENPPRILSLLFRFEE